MVSKKAADKRSDHSLLIEGAKSYPQALAALSEFRNLIVYACREAFGADRDSLAQAFGVRISPGEMIDRCRPDSPAGSDAVNAEIGIRVDRRSEGWRLRYSLKWSKNAKPELWAQLSVRLGRDRAYSIDNALTRLRRRSQYSVGVEGGTVYVAGLITPDQMNKLPQLLRGLNQECIRVWRALGGIKAAGKTKGTTGKQRIALKAGK